MKILNKLFLIIAFTTISIFSGDFIYSPEICDTNFDGIVDQYFTYLNNPQNLPDDYQFLIENWPTMNGGKKDICIKHTGNSWRNRDTSASEYAEIGPIADSNFAVFTGLPEKCYLKVIDPANNEVLDSALIIDKMAPVLKSLIIYPANDNSYRDTVISIFSEAIEPFTFSLPFTCSRPGEKYSAKYAFLSFENDTVIMTCSAGLMHEGDSVKIGSDSIICDLDSNYQINNYENRYIIAELKSSTPISNQKNITPKKNILPVHYQTYTISGRKIQSTDSDNKLSKGFYLHNINNRDNNSMKVIKEIKY